MNLHGQSARVLRIVALFEAFKGAVVFGAGFGLLSLLHSDVRHLAADLVTRLHIDPHSHYAAIFLDASTRLTDARLWALAAFALAYAVLRSVEGWGLWFGRRWGLWLGAASGAIYVPVEAYELWQRPGLAKGATVLLNVAVVVYLVWSLQRRQASA